MRADFVWVDVPYTLRTGWRRHAVPAAASTFMPRCVRTRNGFACMHTAFASHASIGSEVQHPPGTTATREARTVDGAPCVVHNTGACYHARCCFASTPYTHAPLAPRPAPPLPGLLLWQPRQLSRELECCGLLPCRDAIVLEPPRLWRVAHKRGGLTLPHHTHTLAHSHSAIPALYILYAPPCAPGR